MKRTVNAAIVGIVGAASIAFATPVVVSATPLPQTPASQSNAVSKAKEYLNYSAFSRTGLIAQLEYEGFSTSDSTYAVDNIVVNWNEQAAKKAKEYLAYSSFSRSGLIDQLMYEGFTSAQAAYGVNAVGL
ncbi:Ltp family lipoprotein [Tsukamurella sp. USMM236]|uniref:Ltp family lipoprotein n=1 Tax=Tsukamurella sp. USMM236 TaxID=3081301 RepID=UPI003017901E